jgi:hypothetical protein
MLRLLVMTVVLGGTLTALSAEAQQIYRREPPKGALRYGEKVLVDNGKCPQGQIREVTGGKIPGRGGRHTRNASTPRERRCVPRP